MWIIEKFKKAKSAVSKFYYKHKTGCNIAIGLTSAAIVGGLGYVAYNTYKENKRDTYEKIYDYDEILKLVEDNTEETVEDQKAYSCDVEERASKEELLPYWTRGWKEEYRDNWNLVHEFSDKLELEPGESYMIERMSDDETGKNVVSHMVDYTGVYPPDEED